MSRALFLFLTIFLISCFEQGDCTDISGNVMGVNFYKFLDKKALALEIDSIKMVGWDTVMYAGDSINTVKLPINPDVTEMQYIFYANASIDTVVVQYTLQTFALAPECEAVDIITLTKATSNSLPQVTISQPQITNKDVESIKLYF
jgi:hypothetical protein